MAAPHLLTRRDEAHYRAAFALQDAGRWSDADREISAVKDRLLVGSLLAQRYLSHSYRVSFTEARGWLVLYRDQPEAHAIWVLARHRAPRRVTVPRPDASDSAADAAKVADSASDTNASVWLPEEPQADMLRPPPHFELGIAAWRAHRFDEAAQDFETVAKSDSVGSWYASAAAFWTARARLMLHQPERVDPWLEIAAQQPRTFYGLLAAKLLDVDADVNFAPSPLLPKEMAALRSLPAGRRALALVQTGETDRAEAELRALSAHSSHALANAVVALADYAQMPSLCMALAPSVTDAHRRVDAAYPLPRWKPREGYTVDRALMFALMMEESRFETDAESDDGASGLMQLMPVTARAMARQSGIHLRSVTDLVDPELNLSLGQQYVRMLLDHQLVHGNLILLLAAYKSGPAVLTDAPNDPDFKNDPLLFLESLRHQETRLYVERVLTNMWIYRQRLGQSAPDLDQLAANRWPEYVSVNGTQPGEGATVEGAETAAR